MDLSGIQQYGKFCFFGAQLFLFFVEEFSR